MSDINHSEEITKLFDTTLELSNSVAELRTSLRSVASTVENLVKVVQNRGQVNWTMIGVFVAITMLVWTIFAAFAGVVGYMAVESVKSSTNRNELAILRLIDDDHSNQTAISSLKAEIHGTQIQHDQTRAMLRDIDDRSFAIDKESHESQTRATERIRNLERKIYGTTLTNGL